MMPLHHLLPLILLAAVMKCSLQQSDEVLCDNAVVTSSSSNTAKQSAYGILFTVSSSNNELIEVTSLGFYVDENELGTGDVSYEVWTRRGHYADPDRTNAGNGGLPLNETFDYRGNFEYWGRVAAGSLNIFNLHQKNYFQIPSDSFTNTFITGGEVQSFYITLKEVSALMQEPLENWENFLDKQLTVQCLEDGGDTFCQSDSAGRKQPNIHIGEGVASYPFYTVPYFYHPKKFMGTIYYFDKCASRSPTVAPTKPPSDAPTFEITTSPSTTPLPTTSPTITAAPTTRYFFEVDNRCYWYLSTDALYDVFSNETSSSYGMLLPLQSNEEDNDGVFITSLGFHVDFESVTSRNGGTVTYELYTLIANGQYADTNRTSIKFDYRGDFSFWEKISHGTVTQDGSSDYFQIPFDNFRPTYIQPNGGVRSFYLTLNAPALVYKELDKRQGIGKTQKDDDFNSNQKRGDTPNLMIGEVVIGYPFISAEILYSAKQFVGKIFQGYECPSSSPSFHPSEVPSQLPSGKPSLSLSPSFTPSWQPSTGPSISPTTSVAPTLVATDNPSSIPTVSLFPTNTRMPTDSPTSSPVRDLNSPSSSSMMIQQLHLLSAIVCTTATFFSLEQ